MAKKPAKKPVSKSKSAKSKSTKAVSKKPTSKKPAVKAKPSGKKPVRPAPKAGRLAPTAKKADAAPTMKVAKAAPVKIENISAIFSPLDDRVIIEEMKTELRTPGGLYIPDTVAAPEGPKQGKVLAVGRGHLGKKGRIRPLDVQLGDTVLFESYMGSPLKIGDRECVVLRESQLLGIVNS